MATKLIQIPRKVVRPGQPVNWLNTDRGNWQWRGLKTFRVPLNNNPQWVDLVNGEISTTWNAVPADGRPTGLGDVDGDFDFDEAVQFSSRNIVTSESEPLTLVCECICDTLGLHATIPMAAISGVSGNTMVALLREGTSGIYKNFVIAITHATNLNVEVDFPAGFSLTGQRHWLVAAYDGGGDLWNAASWTAWVNGVNCGPMATAPFGGDTIAAKNSVGYYDSAGNIDFAGGIRQCRVYNWAWTDFHAKEWYRLRGNIPVKSNIYVDFGDSWGSLQSMGMGW